MHVLSHPEGSKGLASAVYLTNSLGVLKPLKT